MREGFVLAPLKLNKPIYMIYYGGFIFLLYFLLRYFVYNNTDDHRYLDWAIRDTVMNIPRLVCLLLIFIHIPIKEIGFGRKILKNDIYVIGLLSISLIAIDYFIGGMAFNFYNSYLVVYVLISIGGIFSSLFEEVLFRGIFFTKIREYMGVNLSILISTALYTLLYIGAQPTYLLPINFLYGFILGSIRARGRSIWIVILIHFVHSLPETFFGEIKQFSNEYWLYIFSYIILAVVSYYMFVYRTKYTLKESKEL